MPQEQTFTPDVTAVNGQVILAIPVVDAYLRMSAAAATNLGMKLIQQAEVADGRTPSHLFVIPVGDSDE